MECMLAGLSKDLTRNYKVGTSNLLFFSGYYGQLSDCELSCNSDRFIMLIVANSEDVKASSLSIYNLSRQLESIVRISKDSLVLVINASFFQNEEAPSILLGGFSNAHDRLICELMHSVKDSATPNYLLAAIANLIAVEYREFVENTKFNVIVNLVKDNYLDDEFSLDKLAKLAFMSKRKLQYIMAEKNIYFLDFVNGYRLSHLKSLMHKNPNHSLTRLVCDSGFKNTASANRVVQKHLGLSLKELRRELVICTNTMLE